MKGIVVQFRRSRHRIKEKHYLLDVNCKDRAEAVKMKGKDVEWKSPAGKIIKGKISDAHEIKDLLEQYSNLDCLDRPLLQI